MTKKLNITKQHGLLILYVGIGIISGISSVWLNFLVFETGTLFGLSLSYITIGLLFTIIGCIIYKKGDFEFNITSKRKNLTKKSPKVKSVVKTKKKKQKP